MRLLSFTLSLFAVLNAFAFPSESTLKRQGIEILSPGAVADYKPFSFYAASAYCIPPRLIRWNCGTFCNANSHFLPVASGGDGAVVQYWYVGYDPSLDTIIVAHQGTQKKKIIPILTDANLVPVSLNPSLFPGVSPDVKVHAGFSVAQELAAEDVLAAVKTALKKFGTERLTTVGHSLGAAISLLDALSLKLNFPGVSVRYYGYGLPRVGNQAFADLIDSKLDFTARVTNLKDPIPTLPDMSLGYKHSSGEDHIDEDGDWKACPGQDNPDKQCIDGDVPNFTSGNLSDHNGPYDGVFIGSCSRHQPT